MAKISKSWALGCGIVFISDVDISYRTDTIKNLNSLHRSLKSIAKNYDMDVSWQGQRNPLSGKLVLIDLAKTPDQMLLEYMHEIGFTAFTSFTNSNSGKVNTLYGVLIDQSATEKILNFKLKYEDPKSRKIG